MAPSPGIRHLGGQRHPWYAFKLQPLRDQPPCLEGVIDSTVEVHLRGQPVNWSSSVSMGGIPLLCRYL